MKLAIVVQRYGADINGGAELHARYIAELLAQRHEVEVLTTCARDYITWGNALPEGDDRVNGVLVRRFPVARERDPEHFGRLSHVVFERMHTPADERAWLDAEGPASPALIQHIAHRAPNVDFFFFFSVRYYHAYHGSRAAAARAILVPTAERDPALGVAMFGDVFRGVRGIMYNSPEEQHLIQSISGNHHVPGVVVGIGSAIPDRVDAERFRAKHGLSEPFVIYVGRIDENKGCKELFEFHHQYAAIERRPPVLALVGTSVLTIPQTPLVRHLGFLSDQDKFDAIAAADALIMPSFFESLSMVALEAWALGRPVLANGRCDVLRGQCRRSNAGLYYDCYEEFAEALRMLTTDSALNRALGQNGRRFFTEHYTWPVIERKYQEMLAALAAQPPLAGAMAPEPGWMESRRKTLEPARDVVARVPTLADTQKRSPAPPAHWRRHGGRGR